jgi:hypothetical protein
MTIGTDEALTADETAALEAYKSGADIPAPSSDTPAEPSPVTPDATAGKPDLDAIADELTEGDEADDELVVTKTRNDKGQFVKQVPIHALHKERSRYKQTRTELESLRDQQTKLQAKWDMLHELAGVKPSTDTAGTIVPKETSPFDDPDIDPEVDVIGATKQQKARNAWLRDQMGKSEQARSARENQQSTVNAYINDAKRLSAEQVAKGEVVEVDGANGAKVKVPALQAAYQHLVNVRHVQLEALGVTDAKERMSIIASEEGEMVQRALANKQSPAAMIYKFAVASGFTLNKAATVDPTKHAANQQRVANIKNGMAASASLSGSGQSGDSLTIDKIANMSEAQFSAWSKGIDKAKLRELLGG